MFAKLFSRKDLFHTFFDKHAAIVLEASQIFLQSVSIDGAVRLTGRVKELEHAADLITKECAETLYKTFITPLDRDLIYALTGRLDDIIDSIDAAADCLIVYKIKHSNSDLIALATNLTRTVGRVCDGIKYLKNLKQVDSILEACKEIYRFEHDGDDIFRNAMGLLFERENDAIEIIKWKEVYEKLEDASDKCADVADIIQGILLEHT